MITLDKAMSGREMPAGFAAALARNPNAMDAFSALDSAQRRRVVEKSRTVRSKDEMQDYVSSLVGFVPPDPPLQQ